MRKMLLAAAGSIAVVLPAGAGQAQSHHGSRHDGFAGSFANPGVAGCAAVRGHRDGRGDRRGDRRVVSGFCSDVLMSWYGGEWAKWNNRTWEPTSYNDWWHEAPARAYPAWMQRNQDCSRQWYSGDTLRC